jgi:hypothetical protein
MPMVFYSFMSEKLLITSKYLKLNNNFFKKMFKSYVPFSLSPAALLFYLLFYPLFEILLYKQCYLQ